MKRAIIILLPLVFVVAGFFVEPLLPARVPSHWNVYGEVDGYSSPQFATYFMPLFTLGIAIFLIFVPKLDPKRENWDEFYESYLVFIIIFEVFLLAIHVTSLLIALNYAISMNDVIVIGLSGLFLAIAWLLSNVKQNWFAGVRTPWTLSSEETWNSTHRFASRLFVITAVLTLFALIRFPYRIIFVIAVVLLSSLVLVVFSVLDYGRRLSTGTL